MQEPARPVFTVSILAIVLFLVAALFVRSLLDISLVRRGVDPDVAKDLSYLIVPPILLVLMLPYVRRCRNALRDLFARQRLTLRVVLCSIALGLVMRLLWWASTTFLIGIGVLGKDDPHAVVGPIIGWECPALPIVALSIFVMAVVAPVTEEILHRGFILHGLLAYGGKVAIVASAILFAFVHVIDAFAAAFVAGLVFAIQALNYRALWGPTIAHSTYNAASVFDWDCFLLVWNPVRSDLVLETMTWTSVPAILAGACLIVVLTRTKAAGTAGRPGQSILTAARSRRVR